MMSLELIWSNLNPSSKDLEFIKDYYSISSPLNLDELSRCHERWDSIVAQMKSLCFDDEFGFQYNSKSSFLTFLLDDSTFYFSLNRQSGKSILYGLDHVACRRQFFNCIPNALRLAVFKRKLRYLDLESGLLTFDSDCRIDSLQSVRDIGMGHSVYECEFAHRRVVIKHRPYDVQCVYMTLMDLIGWQTFDHYFYHNQFGPWEFSESLGDQNCNDYLRSGGSIDAILPGLARKAAVGDVFGIGDRHFENYMIKEGHILSVDVSIMFWPNNEEWSSSYISAGLYEISALRFCNVEGASFLDYWSQFFDHYQYYVELISQFKAELVTSLYALFSKEDAIRAEQFLDLRLSDTSDYVSKQKQLYKAAYLECLNREPFKDSLDRIFDSFPHLMDTYPIFKMYYLADKSRLSTFLHSEKKDSFYRDLQDFCTRHDSLFLDELKNAKLQIAQLDKSLEWLFVS